MISLLYKPAYRHVVRASPYAASPVQPVRRIPRTVCRNRRNRIQSVKFRLVHKVPYKFFDDILRHALDMQCPERADRLAIVETAVRVHVIKESAFFIPMLFNDIV